ncbi:hypothetical protein L249_5964 [Ophiocordyceps polyrhachis-furcata BCC 54312]|uniref:Uncharacterized protein n=1 Tax=Ophiocordyceps polyrhachis-furcata BCC 54312 TaxID=1330021 RepID=A0A367LIA4_9HYPO|nr:hypothetical protein L249_5964 [Ophiocordyceps polyrhachis-furcata BCC 54312]
MAPSAAPLDRAPGNTVGWGYSGYSARSTRYSDRYSDRRAHPINLGTRQPLQRSARCTYSGHSARSVVTAVITVIVTAIDALY